MSSMQKRNINNRCWTCRIDSKPWEADKHGAKTLILESDSVVGGISRTVERNGWKFDIGGHRFFTKVDEVYDIWDEILGEQDFYSDT